MILVSPHTQEVNLAPSSGKIPVLYIAGTGRCGSTLLANVIGQVDGFFHVGELWHLWDDGLVANFPCGCGRPFRECPFWGEVLDRAFGNPRRIDPQEMIDGRQRSTRMRHFPLLANGAGQRLLKRRAQPFLHHMEKTYRAIHKVTGGKIIVDSSKGPTYAFLLGLMPGIELSLVHLVRDPRGVAFSSRRKKFRPETRAYFEPTGPAKSALVWLVWNLAIARLGKGKGSRYLRLRYEDFIADAPGSLRQVTQMVGRSSTDLSFLGPGEVRLESHHTVSGNPSRFLTGPVKFHLDDEWRRGWNSRSRGLVTTIARPLLKRYGYAVRSKP